jgi:hypothetical protein
MADWGLYWPQYLEESGVTGKPLTGWPTGREWFAKRLQRGDRLWLFVGGDMCGDKQAPHRAYLTQLFVVADWVKLDPADPGPRKGAKCLIRGIDDRCVLLQPPLEVDEAFRDPGKDPRQSIANARPAPFELTASQVELLLAAVQESCPQALAAAIA